MGGAYSPNRPIVNVVAVIVLLVMVIPVYIAQKLAGGDTVSRPSRALRPAAEPGL